jgi:hypothetical protein
MIVTIDGSQSRPRYEVRGAWRNARSALLTINGERIFQHESDGDGAGVISLGASPYHIRERGYLSKAEYRP